MTTFKAGDRVRNVSDNTVDMTIGHTYQVYGIDRDGDIKLVDDEGDQRCRPAGFYELVPSVGPAGLLDLRSLKAGDRVTIETTYEVLIPADSDGDVRVRAVENALESDPSWTYIYATARVRGAVAVKPLEVGDKVRKLHSTCDWTIRAIVDDHAMLSREGRAGPIVTALTNLTRAG